MPGRLQVSATRLFQFDCLEQRLEVALAETAASLALNNFKEQRRPVFNGLGENLEEVPFLVAIHENAETLNLLERLFERAHPIAQNVVVDVWHAQEFDSVLLQAIYGEEHILHLQCDVLHSRTAICFEIR